MLILTRRPAETIYIGEEVTVTVLGVVGNQVRFGIEAPRSITIDRAEIHERKKRAALGIANPELAAGRCPNGNVADGHGEHSGEVNGNVAEGSLPNGTGHSPTLKLRR
jgi:carbon storage regulator